MANNLLKKLGENQFVKVCGAFDVMSAKLAEMNGFDAIWASGFGISSARALPDAGIITMTELLDAVTFMAEACNIPVIADCDTGYGGPNNVMHMVKKYENAGVAAICIEDKTFPKQNSLLKNGNNELISEQEFVAKIIAAKDAKQNDDFMIIARVEALISGFGMDEALKRATAYEKAGADAILIHSKQETADQIFEFADSWKGKSPIVVIPTTYDSVKFSEIEKHPIKMVILANQTLRVAHASMSKYLSQLNNVDCIRDINSKLSSMEDIFRLQDTYKIKEKDQEIQEILKKLGYSK